MKPIFILFAIFPGFALGAEANYFTFPANHEWLNEKGGIAGGLSKGCGLVVLTRLQLSHRDFRLVFDLSNAGEESKKIAAEKVAILDRSGEKHLPDKYYEEVLEVKSYSTHVGLTVYFPNKKLLLNQKELTVLLPVNGSGGGSSCIIRTIIKRNSKDEQESELYDAFSSISFSLEGGPQIVPSSGIQRLTNKVFHAGGRMYFTDDDHHHFWQSFAIDAYGKGNSATFEAQLGFSPLVSRNVEVFSYNAGYGYKLKAFRRLAVLLEAGMGFTTVSYQISSDKNEVIYYFSAQTQMNLDFLIFNGRSIDISLGTGLNLFWLPSATVGSVDISGAHVSYLGRLILGF